MQWHHFKHGTSSTYVVDALSESDSKYSATRPITAFLQTICVRLLCCFSTSIVDTTSAKDSHGPRRIASGSHPDPDHQHWTPPPPQRAHLGSGTPPPKNYSYLTSSAIVLVPPPPRCYFYPDRTSLTGENFLQPPCERPQLFRMVRPFSLVQSTDVYVYHSVP